MNIDTPTYKYDDHFAHEFGHLLFLKDRYSQIEGKPIGHKGWEENIMNESLGMVELKNIEILFKGIDDVRVPFFVDPWSTYVHRKIQLWLEKGRTWFGPSQHFD